MEWKKRASELYLAQEKKDIHEIKSILLKEYELDINKNYVKSAIYKQIAKDKESLVEKKNKEDALVDSKRSVEMQQDGRQISEKLLFINEEQLKDVNFMLEAHGYSKDHWELLSCRNNIWNTYSKKDGIQTLYSSKITVKPKEQGISEETLLKHFEELLKNYECPNIISKPLSGNIMLEIPIMDLHLSKLGWIKETGESYNHKIAEERLLMVISDIMYRTRLESIEKIVFPLGQDFFNFDNPFGTTAGGTVQDSDSRWQKMFLHGCELIVKVVDMLRQVAPVDMFYVSGNHDRTTSYYLINYLYAWFRNDSSIDVNISPTRRKYYEYGNSLIGYSHSEMEKERITKLMQVEAREMWGRTLYHEWHVGHLHKEKTTKEFYKTTDDEEGGLIVRHIPSITGSDAWHTDSGYVGTVKKAQAFLWHKQYGLLNIINSPIIL